MVTVEFTIGKLQADGAVAQFLLDVLSFAGDKYEADAPYVDEDDTQEYKYMAQACHNRWLALYSAYLKAVREGQI